MGPKIVHGQNVHISILPTMTTLMKRAKYNLEHHHSTSHCVTPQFISHLHSHLHISNHVQSTFQCER
jgi:hypothetical protein